MTLDELIEGLREKPLSEFSQDLSLYLALNGYAAINHAGSIGNPPLLQAAILGKKELVELLIANKANINQTNRYGHTAVAFAAHKGHHEIVRFLIEKGADIEVALTWESMLFVGRPFLYQTMEAYQRLIPSHTKAMSHIIEEEIDIHNQRVQAQMKANTVSIHTPLDSVAKAALMPKAAPILVAPTPSSTAQVLKKASLKLGSYLKQS